MGCDPEKLINLVFLRKSIYNFTDKKHSNKIIQDRFWNEISIEMKTSVAECKSKWACLRNSFASALREEKSKKSGSAASRKKKWYLFKEMSFLSSFMMQLKQTLSNLKASDDESEATYTKKSTENADFNESINEIENEGTNTTSLIDRQDLVSSESHQFKHFVLTTLNLYIDSQEAQESANNDKVSYGSTTSHVPVQEFQTYNYTFSPPGYSSSNSSSY
ncbi:uncharacterized protein LOC113557929 [Rhopalosiphum maidis]|uniref:uncharacterized protein LOC113557929 n=1 Tax=Rhopalosiphum maidis TaxID=43146 RepID=UPI000EFF14C6|nr:uncharacterized protein LOC113557929 [Rhopalosiphum maidis]